MDSFTENILSRARQRANLLTTQDSESEVEQPKILTEKNVVKDTKLEIPTRKDKSLQGSKRNSPQKTKTLCFQKENINMEIKLTSSQDVRVEVEFESCSDDDSSKNDGAGLRKDVKDRLNRLGKLYAGGDDADLSSPIHRTEEKFMSELKPEDTPVTNKHGKKLIRGLANLAEEMNRWEDEVKTSAKPEKPALKWDKSVLDSLESQGFERKPQESKLVYNYIKNTKSADDKKTLKQKETEVETKSPRRFPIKPLVRTPNEQKTPDQKKIIAQDPSSLSISERKALFEKNRGEALLPKAPFGMSIPSNKNTTTNKSDRSNLNSPSAQSPKKGFAAFQNVQLKKVDTKYSRTDTNVQESRTPTVKSVVEKSPQVETTNKQKNVALSRKETVESSPKVNDKRTKESSKNNDSNRQDSWKPTVKTVIEKSNVSPKVQNKVVILKNETVERSKTGSNNSSTKESRDGVAAVTQSGGIANTVEALFKKKNTISEDQIQNQLKEQRMKELEMLRNRFKRKEIQEEVIDEEDESEEDHICESKRLLHDDTQYNSNYHSPQRDEEEDEEDEYESPKREKEDEGKVRAFSSPRKSGGKRSSVSPRVAAVLEDVKRIKVSPVKPGRIYPSLSDIESNKGTEVEECLEDSSAENSSVASYSGTLETSFGKEILEAVCKNQTPVKRVMYEDDSTASDMSDVLGDMDDYLDEALEEEEERESMGPTPPKLSKSKDSSFASHSFNYKGCTPSVSNCFKSPTKRKVSPEVSQKNSVQVVDGEDLVPLTYTVSFYRKQNNNVVPQSPRKVVTREENVPAVEPDKQQEILAKIKSLQVEVQKLQLTISQTSQALNLCNNTLEFMGSTEQVEAEKVLLISTHRRQAILNEIQRLKVEETLRPVSQNGNDIPIEKGVLTISDIILPLKKEYVRALAAAGGKGHHVICLLKCGEEVVSTKLISTVASNIKNPCYELPIPGSISLKNIYNDSTVTLEVYCLQAQEEYLPHDVKYHIKKSKCTPKKSKHESLLSRPVKESPGGPQAVRSPSFALMGYVVFSVGKTNRKSWSLNNTPSMSPLEGSVEMNVTCELTASVECRGFLTMFEDISGFGAWHRRWCLLKGDALSYWKYPDDEKISVPINSIDLKTCITKEVGPVSRDICARPHTFLIETEREHLPTDKETLTTIIKKDKTIIRHLLSADTKEERIKWCSQFNTILLTSKICGKL